MGESLGMARRPMTISVVTLFRGGVLLGMLLAIAGAASPWGGKDGSQLLASQQSFLANHGVRSMMKRGAGEVGRIREDKSERDDKKKKKKKKRVEAKEKKNKNIKKGKNGMAEKTKKKKKKKKS